MSATGGKPFSFALEDFNEDGLTDAAVVNAESTALALLIGKGDGTFKPPVASEMGAEFYNVVAGDFNGDRHTDLAVVTGKIVFRYGRGDGRFGDPAEVGSNGGGSLLPALATANDLNRDGFTDIAAVSYGSGQVWVHLAGPTGIAEDALGYSVGLNPHTVEMADLDMDDVLDLVVPDFGDKTLSIFLGKGDGSFQEEQRVAVTGGPVKVLVADLNADGLPDFVTLNRNEGTVSILLNQLHGGFLPGDGNGDRRVDLADATLALQLAVGITRYVPPLLRPMLDVAPQRPDGGYGDGRIDKNDAVGLLKRAVGLEADLPP